MDIYYIIAILIGATGLPLFGDAWESNNWFLAIVAVLMINGGLITSGAIVKENRIVNNRIYPAIRDNNLTTLINQYKDKDYDHWLVEQRHSNE